MGTGPSRESKGESVVLREVLKGIGVLAILIFLMMWLGGAFVSKVRPGPAAEKGEPVPVKTRKVERREYPLVLDQVGTVRTRTEATISSKIMAQVEEIFVEEGDFVVGRDQSTMAPTVLARLDDRELRARLDRAQSQAAAMGKAASAARAKAAAARAQAESARANRDRAVSDHRRYEDLRQNRAATGRQLDHSRAQRDMAEAQFQAAQKEIRAAESDLENFLAQRDQAEASVLEAETLLGHAVIEAPFTGQVIRKTVNKGDLAVPGRPLFVLDTPALPELHTYVSESLLPHLQPGQEMEVVLGAGKTSCTGKIREIAPQSDPATRTVLVKATLAPQSFLVNGLFGRLRVPCGRYSALVVPEAAVWEVGQLDLVRVLGEDGHPRRRLVRLGESRDGWIEVLSGLHENEEVVLP